MVWQNAYYENEAVVYRVIESFPPHFCHESRFDDREFIRIVSFVIIFVSDLITSEFVEYAVSP